MLGCVPSERDAQVNVELPLNVPSDKAAYVTEVLTKRLLLDHKAYAAHFLHNGKFWTRLSAQLYNEVRHLPQRLPLYL